MAAVLGLWLALNLATLERSPTVWCDEVMFAEPAVRCLAGQGFTATSWPAPAGTPALLNGPLYSLLLVPWLWLWGVGPVAARSLGLLLAGLSAVLLWRLARVTGAVRSARWRLVGVGVLLCGFGVTWGYRSGRYDPLGLLLLVVLAGTLVRLPHAAPPSRLRQCDAGSLGLAALLPFAGLHLLPYAGLLGLAAVATCGKTAWRRLAVPAIGLALGLGLLAVLHRSAGTWTLATAFVAAERGLGLTPRLAQIPRALCADPSLLPLVAFLLGGALVRGAAGADARAADSAPATVRAGRSWTADPVLVVTLTALLVPAWMVAAGKYTPYYGWMAFVPALGGVLHVLDRAAGPAAIRAGRRGLRTGIGVLALGAAAAIGLPLRLALCTLEWRQRDYAPVVRFVESHLRADEAVLTSSETYYAVARHCHETVLPAALGFCHAGIPAHVSALVGGDELAETFGPLGQLGWVPVASCEPPAYSLPVRLGYARWYAVTVWRRR